MAISVPPVETVVSKWSANAGRAGSDYGTAVQSAGPSWQAGVDNAEPNWSAGVNAAAGRHAYTTGVQGKAQNYVAMAMGIGAQRYPSGIQAGVNKFRTGIGKVLAVEAGITLPGRGPTGTNEARSTAVSTALHQAKINGQL